LRVSSLSRGTGVCQPGSYTVRISAGLSVSSLSRGTGVCQQG